jgi:hypothetical protein
LSCGEVRSNYRSKSCRVEKQIIVAGNPEVIHLENGSLVRRISSDAREMDRKFCPKLLKCYLE